jgi:hypothetical protein
MSLEEIEAMDGGEGYAIAQANADADAQANAAPPTNEILEKGQVFSGSVFRPVEPGSPGPAPDFGGRGTRPSTSSGRTVGGGEILEKDQVFSGLGSPGRDAFSEKGQVFSGPMPRPAQAPCAFAEKDQFLPGSQLLSQAGPPWAGGPAWARRHTAPDALVVA